MSIVLMRRAGTLVVAAAFVAWVDLDTGDRAAEASRDPAATHAAPAATPTPKGRPTAPASQARQPAPAEALRPVSLSLARDAVGADPR